MYVIMISINIIRSLKKINSGIKIGAVAGYEAGIRISMAVIIITVYTIRR